MFVLIKITYCRGGQLLWFEGHSWKAVCYVQAIPLVELRAFLTRWLVQRIW